MNKNSNYVCFSSQLLSCFLSNLKHFTLIADATGSPLAETLRVTKIGRLVALMSDCEYKMNGTDSDLKDGHTIENVPAKLLTASLLKTVDIINSINTRLYMPVLKADRAIYLLLLCAKEFGKGQIYFYIFFVAVCLLTLCR